LNASPNDIQALRNYTEQYEYLDNVTLHECSMTPH